MTVNPAAFKESAIFFSQASYRMADVYAILSQDLMASQRPAALSVMELGSWRKDSEFSLLQMLWTACEMQPPEAVR